MTRIAIAVAVTRPTISDLYVLGGHRAINNVPGMNDAKNNTQCPFPNSFETSNGGMMKRSFGNQVPRGAVDRDSSVSFIGQP